MLPGRRGVKRAVNRVASTDLRMPSIHPQQSASSTDSDQVRLGRPVSFL
jgi:hypothetical protein